MTAVFGLTFLFRFLVVDFTNDDFTHLSRARQILFGELPIRDFFDPGQFLHYWLSAAMQALVGYNLFAEALLTTGFLALAAALTYRLASRLSASRWVGAGAALLGVASLPRHYNYPKVFLYVAAIGLAWRYAHRPSRLGLVSLALGSAIAFLFRYDHGAYIIVMMLVLLTMMHGDRLRPWWSTVTAYAGMVCVLLLPFAIYVQLATNLREYVMAGLGPARMIAGGAKGSGPKFEVDRTLPVVAIRPFTTRRATIRWVETAQGSDRRRVEEQHGLVDPVHVEGSTWSYGLTNVQPDNLHELSTHGLVTDSQGIREDSAADVGGLSFAQTVSRYVPLFRLTLPRALTADNALAWFHYVTLGAPFVTLLMAAGAWRAGRINRPEGATMVAAAILCVIISRALVGKTPETRLADVATPTFLMVAWVAGRWLDRGSGHKRHILALASRWLPVLLMFGVTLWSVSTQARFADALRRSSLISRPTATWVQLKDVTRLLHLRPIDDWAPAGQSDGLRALARYVFMCTAPSDRLLVTGAFEPQMFFYTERAFAGGQVHFLGGWHNSLADQRLTIKRLQRESVPIVIAGVRGARGFQESFPWVSAYVSDHYVEAAQSTFGGDRPWRVLVDPRRPSTGMDPVLGLPCYR